MDPLRKKSFMNTRPCICVQYDNDRGVGLRRSFVPEQVLPSLTNIPLCCLLVAALITRLTTYHSTD